MGNAGEVKVFGVGTVCLKTNTGSTLVHQNVKHAPDIPLNLISVGQLDDDGYHNDLCNGQWKLTDFISRKKTFKFICDTRIDSW